MTIYREYEVYKDQELLKFIESLENKFDLLNYAEKYSKLVNFSKNEDVPFHKWFRYREGFSGELIEQLIKDSGVGKEGIIIDPFAGSGTTSVVAKQMDYDTFSVDVNPISSFITNVKLYDYSEIQLGNIKSEINSYSLRSPELIENCTIELNNTKSIEKYFSKNNFMEIIQIKKYIGKIEDIVVQDFFRCGLLCIIEDVSDRRRDGNGLKRYDSKISDVKKTYIKKLEDMLSDIKNHQKNNNCKGVCVLGSAEELSNLYHQNFVNDHDEKTIIFSPPYPNSFDYFESYKLELVVGDFAEDIKDIKKYRKEAIRSFIGVEKQKQFNKYIKLIADEIENRIPEKEKRTGKKDNRTRKVPNMIQGYFYDMSMVIRECYEILNKKDRAYIVVDQSSYLGVVVPTDLIFSYFAESFGFKVNEIIECRKARTSPQQFKQYPYLKHILRESIVVLEK
jgi:possible site-specific DNA-methyltransferase (cytosine-N(4)-specific)